MADSDDAGSGWSLDGPEFLAQGVLVAQKYELLEVLGQGGMAVVVKARHIKLGVPVALKFLKRSLLENAEIAARFTQEAMAAVQLKSEYVARVIDVDRASDGTPFMVMEHLVGSDLGAVLQKRGRLAIVEAVEYAVEVCEALAEAHTAGIIHRDVKPENLFLTRRRDGWQSIKVLDFGISKVALTGDAAEERPSMVETTQLMGSPLYMSPEQIRSSSSVDQRTDIWSLGVVLYELLAGRVPFVSESVTGQCALVLEEPTPSVLEHRPDIPPELAAVIHKCLAKNPDARYQNAAALAIDLLPFGPKRLRASVERSSSLVRSAGSNQHALRVPSTMPPPPGMLLPEREQNQIATRIDAPEVFTVTDQPRPSSSLPVVIGAVVAVLGVVGATLLLFAAKKPADRAEVPTAAESLPVIPEVTIPPKASNDSVKATKPLATSDEVRSTKDKPLTAATRRPPASVQSSNKPPEKKPAATQWKPDGIDVGF